MSIPYPFPKTLFVNEPTNTTEKVLDAYTKWEDSEAGDCIAVYELKTIGKVVDKTTRMLLESNGSVIASTEIIK